MSEQQVQQSGQSALATAAVRVIKKNPVIVSSYVIGIMLCLFFSGITLTMEQKARYQQDLSHIDFDALESATLAYHNAEHRYTKSRGLFSCNALCQEYRTNLDMEKKTLQYIQKNVDKQLSNAKAKLGIFSEIAVQESRDLFWHRFGQGKRFAQRQSMWDAMFMGIGAIGRDENVLSYILRLLLSMAFNFTIGMLGAVVSFMWSLYSVMVEYQASIEHSLVFFVAASLAAVAFAVTWVAVFYGSIAGSIYVVAKYAAESNRIESGRYTRERLHGHHRRD